MLRISEACTGVGRVMGSVWRRRLMLLVLAVMTVSAVVTFGASSVRTGIDQRRQTVEAESLASRLNARIAELSAEVEMRTSEVGVRREALCFGPYVEPGTEVYAVVGVSGCVTGRSFP